MLIPRIMCRTFQNIPNSHRHNSSVASTVDIFHTVFSYENQQRCKKELLTIKPARNFKEKATGRNVMQAAVLIPLCTVGGEPSILFTKRSLSLSNYRGQVSFPGGKVDMNDADRMSTAIRESEEEVGLDPSTVEIWGNMSPVPGKDYKTSVTPVLAFCGEIDIGTLNPHEAEVSEIFTCQIRDLCDPDNSGTTSFRGDKMNYRLPCYTNGPHRIWGLTGVVLHMTLKLLVQDEYKLEFNFGIT